MAARDVNEDLNPPGTIRSRLVSQTGNACGKALDSAYAGGGGFLGGTSSHVPGGFVPTSTCPVPAFGESIGWAVVRPCL